MSKKVTGEGTDFISRLLNLETLKTRANKSNHFQKE